MYPNIVPVGIVTQASKPERQMSQPKFTTHDFVLAQRYAVAHCLNRGVSANLEANGDLARAAEFTISCAEAHVIPSRNETRR